MSIRQAAAVAASRSLSLTASKALAGRSTGILLARAASIRYYSQTSTNLESAATIATIESSFKGAVPNSTLISQIQTKLSPHGYSSGNTLVATSLCADEVNRTLEKSLSDAFDMPNFNMGGLAGFPFGGVTAFGAMASHIPDNGHCLVVYGPHVGVDSTGNVGTVERVGRASGGACCGSAVAAAGYVAGVHLGAAAKYGPSIEKVGESVVQKAFEAVDSDHNKEIDKAELQLLFQKLDIGLSEPEFESVFAELDTSGNGKISDQEFGSWFMKKKDELARAAAANPQDAHQSKLQLDPTDAQQQFVGNMLLPHAERLDKADKDGNKMIELPYALFDAQKGLIDHIVDAGAANVSGRGKIAVLGGIQINTPNEGDDAMEDYFLPLSMAVLDNNGNEIFVDDDHP